MVHLTRQFVERKVKKTYTAILNGIPSEPAVTSITGKEAEELNVDVDPEDNDKWQLIDHTLDEKSAVTVWKPLEYVKSLKAADGTTIDKTLTSRARLFIMKSKFLCYLSFLSVSFLPQAQLH